MPKPQGRCIFCNGTGLTKQHVWPDWLRNVVPRQAATNRKSVVSFDGLWPDVVVRARSAKTRQGDPATKQVRVVCKTCNTGWISQFEEHQLKPILAPLVRGESLILDERSRRTLARWICLFTAVAEFTDDKTRAITANEHAWIKDRNEPPQHWRIWIGHYQGMGWHPAFRIHGFTLTDKPEIYVQVTTMAIGELLAHAFIASGFDAGFIGYGGDVGDTLQVLWPPSGGTLVWPPASALTDTEVEDLADGLYRDVMMRLKPR